MTLMQMSISAGLLITAIVVIRAVGLNRLPKGAFLALWAVAVFRLIVPVSLPWFAASQTQMPQTLTTFEDFLSNFAFIPIPSENALHSARQAFNIPWITIIWLFGMVVLMVFFVISWARSHNRLRFATAIHNNAYLDGWLSNNKLLRSITIMQSDAISTPITTGLLKPRIILPKNMDLADTQTLNHVLIHEYFHIKRFDALWKMLLVVIVCIHWFNPMVWVMLVLAGRDLELTCDEMVVRHFGKRKIDTKTAYATSIINMTERRSKVSTLIYSGFSKNAVAERIEAIMKIKRKTIIGTLVSTALVVGLSIGTLAVFASDNQTEAPFRDVGNCRSLQTQGNPLRGQQQMRRNSSEIGFFNPNCEGLRIGLCRIEGSSLINVPFRVCQNNGQMRRFDSLDELLQHHGVSYADFIAVDIPLRYRISNWSELLIVWRGEVINILEDSEIYEMLRDGATMREVEAVLAAR